MRGDKQGNVLFMYIGVNWVQSQRARKGGKEGHIYIIFRVGVSLGAEVVVQIWSGGRALTA